MDNNNLALMPVMDMSAAKDRRDQIVNFTKSIMVAGVDFGVIPGTDKPTLLKPGAEKLTTFFGLSKRFQVIEKIEDWTGDDHNGEMFFYYLYRCGLYRGDLLIAESDGSCNSFEAKYRWRKGERVCPDCGQPNVRKSKDGGGWYCWKKTGGCGATFKSDDYKITGQEVGRIANPDIADQVNTFQKMAQKRALVAATLLAVNASEFFTQDIEDWVDGEVIQSEAIKPLQPKTQQPTPANQPVAAQVPPQTNAEKPYKFPSTAAETFYKEVQVRTGNYYKNPFHLLETLGGHWFNFANEDIYKERLSLAIDHARIPDAPDQPALIDVEPEQGPGAAYIENPF